MDEYHETSPDMHIKMCKKIAQLTKVIYTLNSRAEEHENILDGVKEDYEQNIQRIMDESKRKILQYKNQSEIERDKTKDLNDLQQLVNDLQSDNYKLRATLKRHEENSKLFEKQLQSDYENKFLILQNKFLERKRDYDMLLERFHSFKAEVETQKQRLTLKYQEEIQRISKTYQVDIHNFSSERLAHEQLINERASNYEALQLRADNEKKILESEYEAKLTKMKTFYETEIRLETTKTHKIEEKKLIQEKTKLLDNYELQKTEMNNRIRFLEKSKLEYEEMLKKSKEEFTSLEIAYEEKKSKCTDLQTAVEKNSKLMTLLKGDVDGKNRSITELKVKLKDSEDQLNLIKKNSLIEGNKKELDFKNLETVLESTKKQLSDSVNKTCQLQAELSKRKMELEGVNQKNNNLIMENEGLKDLHMKAKKSLQEKTDEVNKLQSKLKTLREKDNTNTIDVERHYHEQLQIEKDKNAANIQKFREESEKILKESQGKLLNEMENQKTEYLSKQKQLINTKNQTISKLEEAVKSLKQEFSIVSSKSQEYEAALEKSNQTCAALQNQLNNERNDNNELKSKVNVNEKSLTELRACLANEKNKLTEESKTKKAKQEHIFMEEKKNLEKSWKERSRTLEERLQAEKENALNELRMTYEKEMEINHISNNQKISDLNSRITQLKNDASKQNLESVGQSKKHLQDIELLKKSFATEKQKLMQSYAKEIENLKSNIKKGNQHEIESLLLKQQNALKDLRNSHERTANDLRSENAALINTMKNKLLQEKQDAIKEIQEENSNEKDRLQEFLRLQYDEKIRQITSELQTEINMLRSDYERCKELRQKEFSVHTSKISNLVSDLDKEKSLVTSLNGNKESLSDEIKTLRQELQMKVTEILEIRRECNSRMRIHIDDLMLENNKVIENLKVEFLQKHQKDSHDWNHKCSQLENQISSLKLMLEEAEERYRNREARDEDVLIIQELQQRIFEQEIECQRLSAERKQYRLELVNREENFNKVFNASPNVGFMNPIEIAKRKSLRKK